MLPGLVRRYAADFFSGRLFPCWVLLSQVPFPAGAGKQGCVPPPPVLHHFVFTSGAWLPLLNCLPGILQPLERPPLCCVSQPSLEAAMRVAVDKRRFYKPNRLLTFSVPFGTQARYVRCVGGHHVLLSMAYRLHVTLMSTTEPVHAIFVSCLPAPSPPLPTTTNPSMQGATGVLHLHAHCRSAGVWITRHQGQGG